MGGGRQSERYSHSAPEGRLSSHGLPVVVCAGGLLWRLLPGCLARRKADGTHRLPARYRVRTDHLRHGRTLISPCGRYADLLGLFVGAVHYGVRAVFSGSLCQPLCDLSGTATVGGTAPESGAVL